MDCAQLISRFYPMLAQSQSSRNRTLFSQRVCLLHTAVLSTAVLTTSLRFHSLGIRHSSLLQHCTKLVHYNHRHLTQGGLGLDWGVSYNLHYRAQISDPTQTPSRARCLWIKDFIELNLQDSFLR
ncbi:hypothetical protein V1264_016427 [Littorina saxatilis]|uniref:Uncharacterized protein n=1 Tax=Littorina saxatilis TaxID=31220 RepID=A0AAN9GHZ3_9CAEN